MLNPGDIFWCDVKGRVPGKPVSRVVLLTCIRGTGCWYVRPEWTQRTDMQFVVRESDLFTDPAPLLARYPAPAADAEPETPAAAPQLELFAA